VARGDVQVSIQTTGVIQPENRVEIKPPIAGRVEQWIVDQGKRVKQGEVLAWLSSTERAALLDAARAQGQAELEHWQTFFKPTPLVAPLDGVIIVRNVEAGQTVTQNDSVYVLSDHLMVKANVDETDIGQVKPGMEAQFNMDSYPNMNIEGKVVKIALESQTVNNVTTYEVDILPDQVPPVMKSGMTANVTLIVAEKKDVLVVPAEAVTRENGSSSVLVPGPSKKARGKPVEIETGLTDGKRYEVVSGLQEGDSVLIASLSMKGAASSGEQQVNPLMPSRPRGR
jgi:macrolide-specific efflux system membrane fusion protein